VPHCAEQGREAYNQGFVNDFTLAAPRILARPDHPISRKNVHQDAIKVLYRLHNAGYRAYLVGGSVRDLMLGRRPKDFDVGTDARPNEIRRLFRNSRIIGRRFRLVHVIFWDGVIEVSTFRRDPDPSAQRRQPGELLITSDNTFGTPREDASRRDFTINALFYSIADFSVIDYVGGIEDLERRAVRVIGEPEVRFREDPVRMLRACEFAGRLGFSIEERTQEAIRKNSTEIEKASPARLTEELVQLLHCGHVGDSLQWMLDQGLLQYLMPELYALMTAPERGMGHFTGVLPVVDQMVADGRELTDTALLAVLLLPQIDRQREQMERAAKTPISRAAVARLVERNGREFFRRFALSNVKVRHICDVLSGFYRLCEPRGSLVEQVKLTRQPFFEDALLLFEILVMATGEGQEELDRWRAVATGAAQLAAREPESRRRVRRRRRSRARRRA
jgi:poly(A) polymerase